MPKIRIREVDNTGAVSSSEIPNVVYIPGPAEGTDAVAPKLFTNAKAFHNAIHADDSGYEVDSLSEKMAYHLLTLGMQVIYEGVPVDALSGEPDAATWTTVWNNLVDKNLFDVRFITSGQFLLDKASGDEYSVNALKMVKCAATRCDAVALLDFKTENDEVSEYRTLAEEVENASETLVVDATKEPAAFAAAFAPKWTGNVNAFDGVEKIENLPPSFAYLCAFARSVKENPMWYAVAGSFRGVIPELVEVNKEYSTADVEVLQARAKTMEVALDEAGDNVGVAINPIAYKRPFGHLICGNRTLRKNLADDSGVGILKATSFLNCRILSTEVAKVSYEGSNKYQFEQNNQVLWTNFTSYILPTLDRMSTGNGILDYTIERIATNKRARLSARISLVPVESAEDFDVEIELTDEISVSAS